MTEAVPVSAASRTGRFLAGFLLGLLGHGLAVVAAFVTVRVAGSSGEGFEDLARALLVFLGLEVAVAVACVAGGLTALVRRRREFGTGLLVSWFAGAVAVVTYLTGQW